MSGGIITAPGGRVELGGLSEEGTVGINNDGSLSFPLGVQRADVTLSNEATVDVRASGASNVRYKGGASVDSDTSGASSVRKG